MYETIEWKRTLKKIDGMDKYDYDNIPEINIDDSTVKSNLNILYKK